MVKPMVTPNINIKREGRELNAFSWTDLTKTTAGKQQAQASCCSCPPPLPPPYHQLGRDGSLGVYEGRAPDARKAKLWAAGTGSKSPTESSFELVYSGDRVSLLRDGKVGLRRNNYGRGSTMLESFLRLFA